MFTYSPCSHCRCIQHLQPISEDKPETNNFSDDTIFCGDVPLRRPYIGRIYGRHLQFRFLNGHWLILKTKHVWATKMHRASTKPVDNVDKQAKTWLLPNTSSIQTQGGKLGRQRDKEVVTGRFPLQKSGQHWSMGYIVKSNCLIIKTCWNMLVGGIPALWKIWKSVRVTIPNIWKVIKFMFQTTNQHVYN